MSNHGFIAGKNYDQTLCCNFKKLGSNGISEKKDHKKKPLSHVY